jgi:type III secretion system YscQ/HrcQ family protein
MMVTSFDLAGCPSVSRASAAASRTLGQLMAAWPAAWIVELPLLGKATMTPTTIVPAVPRDAIAFAVRRDGIEGRLSLPGPLASRWVDLALCGPQGFGPARELGRAERGVLVALLGPLLDAPGWSFGLGPPPEREGPAIAVALSGAAGGGTVWLQIPPLPPGSWVTPVGRSVDRPSAGLPVVAGLRVASTTLTHAEVAELAAGDLVLFDGVAARAIDGATDVDLGLWLGRFCAMLRVTPDGRATVSNGWKQATGMHEAKDVSMDADSSPVRSTAEAADRAAEAPAALAQAPVEVVAELGRITLRADEVLGLAPGVVLGLRIERTTAVALRVGGQVWAEGELVNVDGEVGVRVTRLTRG